MNAKMIMLAMTLVLAGLFIFTKFFRKNEEVKSKLEVAYFESLIKLKSDRENEQLKTTFQQAANHYGQHIGLEGDAIQKMMERDLLS